MVKVSIKEALTDLGDAMADAVLSGC